MKYFKLKQIALALVLVVMAVSCIEDAEPIPQKFMGYGFINKIGQTYFVDEDGGLNLELMPFDDTKFDFEENNRVWLQFTLEKEYEESDPARYLVNLQGLWVVDYSPAIVELTTESRDTIGKGFVELEYPLVLLDNYLNLSVRYRKQEGNHVFSLCYDETAQEEGKPIILDLKNKQPEEGKVGQMTLSYQSFNISQLQNLGEFDSEGEMKFTLRINNEDSQEANFDLIYKPILE